MRFKVGTKVVCTNVYSGRDFDNRDVVEIVQIGCEDDPNCYGAISPHDGGMWYLYEEYKMKNPRFGSHFPDREKGGKQ